MDINHQEFEAIHSKGFLLKKNILNETQIEKIKKLVKLELEGKDTTRGFIQ